jgi:hypothetical protein
MAESRGKTTLASLLRNVRALRADDVAYGGDYRSYAASFAGYTTDQVIYMSASRRLQRRGLENRREKYSVTKDDFVCSTCGRPETVMGVPLHKFILGCGDVICGNCMARVVDKMDYSEALQDLQNGEMWCPACASQGINPRVASVFILATLKEKAAFGEQLYLFAECNSGKLGCVDLFNITQREDKLIKKC